MFVVYARHMGIFLKIIFLVFVMVYPYCTIFIHCTLCIVQNSVSIKNAYKLYIINIIEMNLKFFERKAK